MKTHKILIHAFIVIALLCAGKWVFAAQQTLNAIQKSSATNAVTVIREGVNTELAKQQTMNTELYTDKANKASTVMLWSEWANGTSFTTSSPPVAYNGVIYKCIAPYTKNSGEYPDTQTSYFSEITSSNTYTDVPEGTENQIPVYGATGSLEAVTPLTPVAGANITITPNTTAKTLTIAATSPTGATVPSAGIVTSNGTILSSTVPGTGILAALAAPVDGAGGLASKESVDAVSVGSPVVIAPTYSDSACTAGQYAFSVSPSIYWCKASNTWDYQVVSGSSLVWAGWNNPTPAPITGVSDDFSSDCSTTTCTSYTAINGGITVSGGTAGGATGWARNFVYHETSLESANQDVSASVTYSGSSDSAGVIFRVNPVATPTGYMAVFSGGKVSLYSFSGTTRTLIDSSTYASYTAGTYTLRATSNGTTIKLYVDGTERLSITNSEHTEGNFCGLAFVRDLSNVDVRADSFFGAAL